MMICPGWMVVVELVVCAGLAAAPGLNSRLLEPAEVVLTGSQESQTGAPPPVGQKERQVRGKEPTQQPPQ